jgi:hypothetical protein
VSKGVAFPEAATIRIAGNLPGMRVSEELQWNQEALPGRHLHSSGALHHRDRLDPAFAFKDLRNMDNGRVIARRQPVTAATVKVLRRPAVPGWDLVQARCTILNDM